MTFRNAVDQLAAYEDTLIPKLLAKLPQLKEDPYTLLIEDEQIVQLDVLRMHAEGKSDLTEEYKEARDLPTIDSESLALYSLRHLGMESALVSGAYLESSQNPMSKENHFSACAGAVVNQLRNNGIPTDISANIWPPKDQLREAGHEMKQTGQAGFTVDKFYK
jgi:hypothetical protein